MKEIISGKSARDIMMSAVNKVCDIVSVTLGPKGRNIIIDDIYKGSYITNDGVTIAKEIELSDRKENVIGELVKEAAIKTNEKVGDGTTTTLVLLKSIFNEGIKLINEGYNPMVLKREIQLLSKKLSKELENISWKPSKEELLNIACISSNSNYLGNLSFRAINEVGVDGIVILVETKNNKSSMLIENGYQLESGSISPYLLKNKKEEILDNPYILITDLTINEEEVVKILNVVGNKSLLLIADDYSEEAIKYLSFNKKNNISNIIAIKSPEYSDKKDDVLNDLGMFTNSEFITYKLKGNLENLKINDLKQVKKIKITKEKTIIINNTHNEEKINILKKQLIKEIKKEESEFEKEFLERRLSNLNSKIAVIKVGGKTKTEILEKKMRIEDSLHAIKVASKNIVEGGGISYLKIINSLNGSKVGKLFKSSLKEPFKQIIRNIGLDEERILAELKNGYVFDAVNEKFVESKKSKIIDPLQVAQEALLNASSIASMLLTTETIIVDYSPKDIKLDSNFNEVI